MLPVVFALNVIDVVPWLYPAVQFAAFLGSPDQFGSALMKQTSPPRPPQLFPAVKVRNVWFGPAPRSVTLFLALKMMPVDRLYVPAFRNTT